MTATQEITIAELFDQNVARIMANNGHAREPAERLVGTIDTRHREELRRRQNLRYQQSQQPAPLPTPLPPAKTSSRPRLLTLAQDLKIPAAHQMAITHQALATSDPEAYVRQFAADLAAGKAEIPAVAQMGDTAHSSICAAAVAQLAGDDELLLEGLEELMLAMARATPQIESAWSLMREFGPQEQRLFLGLKLDKYAVALEHERCCRLLRFKAAAGTPEERAAARQKAAEAVAAVQGPKSEAEKLRKKIAELTDQLQALEQAAQSAQADIDVRDAAVAGLIRDTNDENFLVPPRRFGWPACGVLEYVARHVGQEPGQTLSVPPRRHFGERSTD